MHNKSLHSSHDITYIRHMCTWNSPFKIFVKKIRFHFMETRALYTDISLMNHWKHEKDLNDFLNVIIRRYSYRYIIRIANIHLSEILKHVFHLYSLHHIVSLIESKKNLLFSANGIMNFIWLHSIHDWKKKT